MPRLPGIHVVEHHAGGERPLVILVHGTMDRSASFARAVRLLPTAHVITYDRRGYGRSAAAPPASRGVAGHVDDLVEILDGRRAVAIGHSFGGDVVLLAAVRHPELIVAAGAYEPPMPWLEWWPTGSASQDLRAHGLDNPGEVAERFIRLVAGDAAWEGLPDHTKERRRAEGSAVLADVASLTDGGGPFSLGDLTSAIGHGAVVRLACGQRSRPHQHGGAELLARKLGVALTMIEGATHGGHSGRPAEFASWVRTVMIAGGASAERVEKGAQ